MADLNFPQDPYVGQTYSIGTRTWQWNGSGWALQSGILSTNPFRVVSIEVTTTTNSTSTNSGAIIVAGGGGFGGNIYAKDIYSNGSAIVTTATIGNFGVSAITAGTDTSVSVGVGNVYTIWNTSTLQSVTGRGAITSNAITISNTTNSTATNTGALTVTGSVGIGSNLNVGGNIRGTFLDNYVVVTQNNGTLTTSTGLQYTGTDSRLTVGGVIASGGNILENNVRVLTNVKPAAGTAISITSVSTSNGTMSFTINNQGVTSLAGTTYLGISAVSGDITLTNLGVTTLTAGTDTAVSQSTGTITVWSTSTLQSITNRGAATSNAISISNATGSSTSTGGALTVTGGVGIGQNLNIGGTLNVWGAATFSSPVTFSGTATYVYSTNTYYTDNLIELHTTSTGVNTEWTFDDGKDIGLRFHYYNRTLVTGTNAALVLADDSQLLEWYSSGAESNTGTFANGVYGGFKTGLIQLTGTGATASSSAVSNQSLTISANGLGVTGASYFANNVGIGGTAILSSAGVTNNFTVSGATTLGGAVTANSSLGVVGALNVTGTTTLSSLGVINGLSVTGTTTLAGPLNVTNGTSSAGTNTGAIIVAGGVGVGENLNVGGNLYVAGVINATVVGSISTATNLTAGSSGSIPYQTAFGRTSFFGPGAAGDLLVSNGGGSPTFVNTLTLAGTTQATNTMTGTLQVRGGAGIGKNLYVGGTISSTGTLTVIDTTDSTSTTSGALVIAGGAGIGKNLNIGGAATVGSTLSVGSNLTAGGNFTATGSVTFNGVLTPTPTYFTGTIVGTTLTVTGITGGGKIAWEQYLEGAGLAADTFIVYQLSGISGGNGTYKVSVSQNIGPVQMSVAAVYIDGSIKLDRGHSIYVQDEHDPTLYDLLIGIKEIEGTIHLGSINTNGVSITNDQEYKVESALNTGTFMAVAKVNTVDEVTLASGNSSATFIRVGGDSAVGGYGMKFKNGGQALMPVGLRIGDDTNASIFQAPLEVSSRLQGAVNNQSSPAGAALTTYRGTGSVIANDEWGSYLYGARFRGTLNSPLPTKNGDWLMEFGATSFDGSNSNGGGEIAFRVDGPVTTGVSNPSKVEVYTTPQGSVNQELAVVVRADKTIEANGNLTVAGTSTLANPVLIGPVSQYISFVSPTTTTNATITLDSFAITDYQTAKYLVQIEDRGFTPKKIHVEEMVLFHDDNGPSTLVYLNTYAISSNLGELGVFDVNYAAGNITLTFTPNYTPTQLLVKTVRTAIMS
jgi:hypothetical protein